MNGSKMKKKRETEKLLGWRPPKTRKKHSGGARRRGGVLSGSVPVPLPASLPCPRISTKPTSPSSWMWYRTAFLTLMYTALQRFKRKKNTWTNLHWSVFVCRRCMMYLTYPTRRSYTAYLVRTEARRLTHWVGEAVPRHAVPARPAGIQGRASEANTRRRHSKPFTS